MQVYTVEEEEVFFDQIDKIYELVIEGSFIEAEDMLLELASDVPKPREDNTLGAILLDTIQAFYEQTGQPEMALSHFLEETDFLKEKMKTQEINNPAHFLTTGHLYYGMKDFNKARAYFKIALATGKNKIFQDADPNYLHMARIEDAEFETFILTIQDNADSGEEQELTEVEVDQIEEQCAQANEAMENGDFPKAIEAFTAALTVLPEPKNSWDAYAWIAVGLGDAYFSNAQYFDALSPLHAANDIIETEQPDGFLYMRIGQCYFELNDLDQALTYLKMAYAFDGGQFFEGEDAKYLRFLNQTEE